VSLPALMLMITVWVIVTAFMLIFLVKVIRKPMSPSTSEPEQKAE
jgi:hypothetical protein